MGVLLDTNVVLRPAEPDVRAAVARLRAAGARVCVAPQSCVEAYVVATRPVEANGLGLSVAEAIRLVDRIGAAFEVAPDPPGLYATWRRVVAASGVRGVRAHDARLGAYAASIGLDTVVTHNVRDFAGFAEACGVRVVRPEDVEPETKGGRPG